MTEKKTATRSTRSTVDVKNIKNEREDTVQASRRLLRSLFQAGRNLIMVPIRLLPAESQKHMEAASREFTLGVASLTREVADGLERLSTQTEE